MTKSTEQQRYRAGNQENKHKSAKSYKAMTIITGRSRSRRKKKMKLWNKTGRYLKIRKW